jgi:hypothetical protein
MGDDWPSHVCTYVLDELPVKLDGIEGGTQVHWNNP